jgi:hypothetical protein
LGNTVQQGLNLTSGQVVMHACQLACSYPAAAAAAALPPQEQAYLQKYPGRPRHEWGGKVQRYKPPGSSVIAEITLWEVVRARLLEHDVLCLMRIPLAMACALAVSRELVLHQSCHCGSWSVNYF